MSDQPPMCNPKVVHYTEPYAKACNCGAISRPVAAPEPPEPAPPPTVYEMAKEDGYSLVIGGIRPAAASHVTLNEYVTLLRTQLATERAAHEETTAENARLREKADAYDRINTPEVDDFLSAVRNEALHQRERWTIKQDGDKQAADWFWLVGYLAGKALHDINGKRLHHIITASAALLNWHGQETGNYATESRASLPSSSTVSNQ